MATNISLRVVLGRFCCILKYLLVKDRFEGDIENEPLRRFECTYHQIPVGQRELMSHQVDGARERE